MPPYWIRPPQVLSARRASHRSSGTCTTRRRRAEAAAELSDLGDLPGYAALADGAAGAPGTVHGAADGGRASLRAAVDAEDGPARQDAAGGAGSSSSSCRCSATRGCSRHGRSRPRFKSCVPSCGTGAS